MERSTTKKNEEETWCHCNERYFQECNSDCSDWCKAAGKAFTESLKSAKVEE